MVWGRKMRQVCANRKVIGPWTVSVGTIGVLGVILVSVSLGVVYAARFGGGATSNSTISIDLQRDLIGHWKLDGNVKDSTPNGRNGSLIAAPTLATDRRNVAGRSYSFDGINSHINIPSDVSYKYTGAEITFSSWFNANPAESDGGYILSKPWNGGGGYNYRIKYGTYSNNLVYIEIGGATLYSTPGINAGGAGWHLVTATVANDSTVRVYIDGQLTSTTTHNVANWNHGNGDTNVGIALGSVFPYGSGTNNSPNSFYGSVDDPRVYKRVLNAEEVMSLYKLYESQLGVAQGKKGLLGQWDLDGNPKDATPYANDGVFTGGAAVSDRKNSAGKAYTFNASTSKMVLPNPVGQSGVMTASVWYKRNDASSAANWRTILGHKTANIHPLILQNGTQILGIFDGSFRSFGYTVPNDTTWHHYVVIYDSAGTAQLYVDGTYITQIVTTLNLGVNPIGMVGNWQGNGYWAGEIDDVRLYNRALSLEEIQQQTNSYDSKIGLGGSNQINLSKGLIGSWPLNINTKDTTVYALNGTLNGALSTTDRRGRNNAAYDFNGTSDNISLPDVDGQLADKVSISAWIYPTDSANVRYQGIAGNRTFQGFMTFVRSGQLYCDILTPNGRIFFARGAISNNQWQHISCTYDGAAVRIYINGVQAGANAAQTGNVNTTWSTGIIGGSGAAGEYFQGKIDDVRFYNRALADVEVKALYDSYN